MKRKNWIEDSISMLGKAWQSCEDECEKKKIMFESWFVRYYYDKEHPERGY